MNYRGRRLPLVGWVVAVHEPLVAAIGFADDLWSGPERGFRRHLSAGRTTGVLKLLAIPAYALARTRSLSGALLVGLAANALNQLDTCPGRALKAYIATALAVDAPLGIAVLLLPYDLREMTMLGDAGANALGALLGLNSVDRLTGRGRWIAIGGLAGLTVLGEHLSLGAVNVLARGVTDTSPTERGVGTIPSAGTAFLTAHGKGAKDAPSQRASSIDARTNMSSPSSSRVTTSPCPCRFP